jgi:hypothetical protein
MPSSQNTLTREINERREDIGEQEVIARGRMTNRRHCVVPDKEIDR